MIKKLFRIELIKNLGYTNFWVLTSLWVLLFILSVVVVSQISIGLPGLENKPYMQFPSVWTTVAWLASWFNLLLAIIVIVNVGNEFSFKTFRSQVICGLKREELIFGKLLFIFVLALISTILVTILSIAFGFIFTIMGSETSILEKAYTAFIYFVQAFGYMTLGMLVAILLKNTALSIVVYILYFFPGELILRSPFPDSVELVFPFKVISNLTPLPDIFSGFTGGTSTTVINGEVVSEAAPVADLATSTNVILALIYITVFIISSSIIVKKRNL